MSTDDQESKINKLVKQPVDLSPFKKHAFLMKTLFGVYAVKDPALVRFLVFMLSGTLLSLVCSTMAFFLFQPELAALLLEKLFYEQMNPVTRDATTPLE